MLPQRYLILKGTFRPPGGRPIGITAMLDSGANANFINHEFTRKHGIPLDRKTRKIPLRVIDGTLIASRGITHHTSPGELKFGGHQETLSLDVIMLGDYNIILGISWLIEHNPRINWARQTLELETGPLLAGSTTLEPVE